MTPAHRHRHAHRTRELLSDAAEATDIAAVARCGSEALVDNDAAVAAHVAALHAASQLACTAGCAACCRLHVAATFPEMAALAEHLAGSLSPDALDALRQRIDARCEEESLLDPRERATGIRDCVLLQDKRCSAYEARPLACRGWNSADAAPCFIALESPREAPSIPVHALLRTTALEIARGISDGVRDVGFDDAPLGLPQALRELLARGPEVTMEWLQGRMLPAEMKSPAGLERILGADGKWRLPGADDDPVHG